MTQETGTIPPLDQLMKDKQVGEEYVETKLDDFRLGGGLERFMEEMRRESSPNPEDAYPSQGLVRTPHDGKEISEASSVQFEEDEFIEQILPAILFHLETMNHPTRIKNLHETPAFKPPQALESKVFERANERGDGLSINQLAVTTLLADTDFPRSSRAERFAHGPFVRLGNQPRLLFVGSANPECWGSAAAIAHMSEAHSLVGISRDGPFASIKRQADLAEKAIEMMENSPVLIGRSSMERAVLLELWKKNAMGVLEVNPRKALERAERLYGVGVRTFRLYSPEPGSDLLGSLNALKKFARAHNWEDVEIFAGQVVNVKQAKELERAGATGLYVGIGGGGRCTTAVRGALPIDWPQLVWELRGKLSIPVIVEGGASDAVGQSLAVGATGIGVSRVVAGGTIESPGGWQYLRGKDGKWFKPYGGEASGRVKYMGGREGPFGIIPYIEGATTLAYRHWGMGEYPTILDRLSFKNGDLIVAMVMTNAENIADYQDRAGKALRSSSSEDASLRYPH